jgi:transposase-like protein
MKSPTRAARNETMWRERVERQAASGKTIAAFSREEGIGQSTLSYWRKRLGVVGGAVVSKRAVPGKPFLDVGPVSVVKPPHYTAAQVDTPNRCATGVQLRLELGDGIVLHIARS